MEHRDVRVPPWQVDLVLLQRFGSESRILNFCGCIYADQLNIGWPNAFERYGWGREKRNAVQ